MGFHASYVFRIDDVTPGANWPNLERLERIFDAYGVKPVVGVVPDNRDPKLSPCSPVPDFWDRVRRWSAKGWTIAQHGFTHEYVTQDPGILGLNGRSEFAGLPYAEQFRKLSEGQGILRRELSLAPTWWMAPAHGFDVQTCRALRELGFTHVTDGIALFPFEKFGLKWLPQQLWKPSWRPFGTWTICLHPNGYGEAFFSNLESFLTRYASLVANPAKVPDAAYRPGPASRAGSAVYATGFFARRSVETAAQRLLGAASFPFRKSAELREYGSFVGFFRGCLGYARKALLLRRFRFDPWHVLPIEWRPYALFTRDFIAREARGPVVEVGCGLGELLEGLPDGAFEGYDLSESVVRAARSLRPRATFVAGSFDDLSGKDADFLITVNFIHEIRPDTLRALYAGVLARNRFARVLVDRVPSGSGYRFAHDFPSMFPGYRLESCAKGFAGGREILVFSKRPADVR